MSSGRRIFTFAIIALIGVAAAVYFTRSPVREAQQPRGRGGFQGDGPVPVIAAQIKRADVPVYLDGVGTVRALNTVTVKSQVDGKLIQVAFREGQDVKRGFVLAKIDPTTYQAQLDQAVAKKAQDEATLANAKIDLERYARLVATNSVARQQYDTQKATVAQLEAQVRLDQAAIDNARAILEYTDIRAPLDGRTGLRLVDEGNIVRASDSTGLVVITQLQPISVLFTLPQQNLGAVNRAFTTDSLAADAFGADNKTVIDRGTLRVVDNQVDQTTGTIKLKAEFPNAQFQLWPGQFVNVRLLVDTLKQVVVAPTAAVQRGPSGTFVYTVQTDDTVAIKQVNVGQQDEVQAVITSGLEGSERVVTTGFARLTAGSKVVATSAEDTQQPSPAPAVQPRRERRPAGAEGQGAPGGGQGRRERRSEAAPAAPR